MTVKPTQDDIGNEYSMADVFSQLIAKQHTAKGIHCYIYLLSLDLQWHAGAMQYLLVNLLSVHIYTGATGCNHMLYVHCSFLVRDELANILEGYIELLNSRSSLATLSTCDQ